MIESWFDIQDNAIVVKNHFIQHRYDGLFESFDFRISTPSPQISNLPNAENPTFRELSHAPYSRYSHNQLTTAAAKAALRDFPKMSRKQIGNDDQSEGLRNFAKSGSEKKEGSRTEICFSKKNNNLGALKSTRWRVCVGGCVGVGACPALSGEKPAGSGGGRLGCFHSR